MKTRLLLIFVCLLVSLTLLLTACNGGTTQSSSSTITTTTTKTTSTSSTSVTTASSATTSSSVTTTTSTGTTNSLIDILGLGKDINSIKFDLTVTTTGLTSISMTVWQKQQKMKADMSLQGTTISIIFDMATNVMYSYMPGQNTATKTTIDNSMVPESPINDVSGILDYSPNVIGTETIDGKVCTVVTYDKTELGSIKMWIWNEKGLPLKMEVTADGNMTTIEYKNIDLSDIPDSMFELPEGVTIVG
jgi:hypothetical protein